MLLSLCAHIFVPLIALVAVAVIQFDRSASIPAQVAEGGTDLCILAIGATGSMFIQPWAAPEIRPWVDVVDKHHYCVGYRDPGGRVDSRKPLVDGRAGTCVDELLSR